MFSSAQNDYLQQYQKSSKILSRENLSMNIFDFTKN
jgi:hypothetical protein